MQNSAKKQQGFTLVGLMIGLFVSMTITAGALQTILSMKANYSYQEEMAMMHENARYAAHLLAKNIRKGGYLSCYSNSVPANKIQTGSQLNGAATYTQGIVGHNADSASSSALTDWTPTLSNFFTAAEVKEGTDVISIQHLSHPAAPVTLAMTNNDDDIQIDKSITPQAGDVLVISDCDNADLFRATAVTSTADNHTIEYTKTYNLAPPSNNTTDNSPLEKAYGANAKLGHLVNNTYFIADNADGDPSLWRYTIGSTGSLQKAEIINGIEDFQLLYGEDTDNDGSVNAYLTSNNVTDWNNVLSIKAFFLLYSANAVVSGPNTYQFMGNTTTANDKILRKQFITTIKLRTKGTM